MKRLWAILTGLLLCLSTEAQQDPMYSMYMFNGLVLNPAYAGSREQASFTLLNRNQWMGIEGGPRTQTFSMHAPTPDLHHGWGLTLANDQVGFTSQFAGNFTYAYRIHLNDNARLSLGLNGGATYYKVRLSEISTWDPQDPAFLQGDFRRWMPNAGAGIYFNTKKMYIGASMPNFLPSSLADPYYGDLIGDRARPFFATAGVAIPIKKAIHFKPSVLLKYNEAAGWHLDLNASALLKEILWLGVSYRPQQAWVFMAEVNVTPMIRLGYAMDREKTTLATFGGVSHEFMLGFDLGVKKGKMVSPRLF